MNATQSRSIDFIFCPDFKGAGPRLVQLASQSWRRSARQLSGLDQVPFYSRPARPGEPPVHDGGHPWAWSYTSTAEMLADEARVAGPESCELLRQALQRANLSEHCFVARRSEGAL